MMLSGVINRCMRLRFVPTGPGHFGPRYWVLGVRASRETYWRFVHLRIWLARQGL